ncbi:MAG: hypothetical protein II797_01920, partial [Clostridia bacterium]|nr:hypothetical protein [Clostridia bacterium]
MEKSPGAKRKNAWLFFRLLIPILAFALALATVAPLMAVDKPMMLERAEWAESKNLAIMVRQSNLRNVTQNRLLMQDGTPLLLTVYAEKEQALTNRVCNLYQVISPDIETGKKDELFCGQTTYGCAELLASSDGTLYTVSGASSRNYLGEVAEEFAEGEINRYNPVDGSTERVRTCFVYRFGEGSGYVFRKACLDEAAERIFLFYTSEDGTRLEWLIYDLAKREFSGIRSVQTDLPVSEIYAFAVGNGDLLLTAQPQSGDSFLLLLVRNPDGISPEVIQKTQSTGRPADIVKKGDVYLDK